MIKLLIECKGVDRKIINGRGFTALDVLQRQTDQVDSAGVKILRSYSWSFEPSRFNEKLTRDIMSMKPETANAVLVVLALVLTMTYQALLSPPGSVFQGDAGPASDPTTNKVGKSVINPASFLLFYIPNGIAFLMAWIVTILLLQVVAESIFRLVYPLYIVMCFCYGSALGIIQPSDLPTWFAYVPSLFVILVYYPALYRFRKR
ncbi:hypothetical protein COLO4_14898 [Corchorus olitorius]|uniref:PGG domain-containing protein n=1 Tax=Corchorus olitorius TaxID=93759 RepID=A0A1R3JQ92_9ROSI|nr:hypothetical protein COLO4_14898 [Corchorus olitorius]